MSGNPESALKNFGVAIFIISLTVKCLKRTLCYWCNALAHLDTRKNNHPLHPGNRLESHAYVLQWIRHHAPTAQKGGRLMFISVLSQSYLVAYGFCMLIWVIAFALFSTFIATDIGWSIDEDDYFDVARGAGLVGLGTSALYLIALIAFTRNGLSTLENAGITFNWDIAWVAPTTTVLGTIIAPVLLLVLTKILKITFSITGTITKTMKTALYDWCYALSRIGARKK